MGEIADMMIDGECCQWCGDFFGISYGYPVICKSCARGATPEELRGVQVAGSAQKELPLMQPLTHEFTKARTPAQKAARRAKQLRRRQRKAEEKRALFAATNETAQEETT